MSRVVTFQTLETGQSGRATINFDQLSFEGGNGRSMRFEFLNVPPDLATSLVCRVMGDRMGWPDATKTTNFHHGDVVQVPPPSWRDRNYYIGPVGWTVEDLLSRYTNATIRLSLVP
jgi:hypothetical protein